MVNANIDTCGRIYWFPFRVDEYLLYFSAYFPCDLCLFLRQTLVYHLALIEWHEWYCFNNLGIKFWNYQFLKITPLDFFKLLLDQ